MKILTFLFFFLISIQRLIGQETVFELQVVNTQKEAIPFVTAVLKQQQTVYCISDIEGRLQLNVSSGSFNDTAVISCLGYEKKLVPLQFVKRNPVIVLNQKVYTLAEINIKPNAKPSDVLKKCIYNNSKQKPGPYYGKAGYEKAVFCNNKAVEVIRAHGAFYTSGNIKHTKFDEDFFNYFVAFQVARSYPYDEKSIELLEPLYAYGKNIRYNSLERPLFKAMRALECCGPISKECSKYYDINFVEYIQQGDILLYKYSFAPKKDAFPNKLRVFCRGILLMDPNGTMLKMQVEDLNIVPLVMFRMKEGFPAYKCDLNIYYFKTGNNLIQKSVLTNTWNATKNESQKTVSFPTPSRRSPEKNKLIEMESFEIDTVISGIMNKKHREDMLNLFRWAGFNLKGTYSASFWTDKSSCLNLDKINKDLSFNIPLTKQFEANSNKYYMPISQFVVYMNVPDNDASKIEDTMEKARNNIKNIIYK